MEAGHRYPMPVIW